MIVSNVGNTVYNVDTTLDVLTKYKDLISTSLSGDSVYIRAKETVEELSSNGDLKDTDKAKIIAEVMAGLNSSLVNGAMSTALAWSKEEKQNELRTLELDQSIRNEKVNEGLIAEQVNKLKVDNIAIAAEARRNTGATFANAQIGYFNGVSNEIDLSDTVDAAAVQADGSNVPAAVLGAVKLNTDNANALKEGDVLVSNAVNIRADTHKTVADTYVNYGSFTYSGLDDTGLTSKPAPNHTRVTLSDVQHTIASEQAKGYTYNAWNTAATGTSSFLATLVAGNDTSNTITNAKAQLDSLLVNLGSIQIPTASQVPDA